MSLIQNANRLEVAEVEIEFIPGIPQIHFLGLPDRIIKESFYRIKSALKNSGFKFPVTNQMIVNIKPNHLRKSSRGVELAVALGILIKTEQVPAETINSDCVIYGELGLDGRVYEPTDLKNNFFNLRDIKILTGVGDYPNCFRINGLADMQIERHEGKIKYVRPDRGLKLFYAEDEAEFLFLAACGRLHSLLAGDSGAGKSTLAHTLASFLPMPQVGDKARIENSWYPVVAPHQSISPAAFLGGGSNLFEGEIERAQGGILLLDEFLEFAPEIIESLRGPMTGEKLRLSRAAGNREFVADFQVIATTNLCICGKWTPLKKNISCRFSRRRCSHYLEKLSGPIIDRFGLLFYCRPAVERKISGEKILDRVLSYYKVFNYFSSHLSGKVVQPKAIENYYSNQPERRKKYLNRIAFVYALEKYAQDASVPAVLDLTFEDYTKAERWVIKPFDLLEKGMG